MRKTRGDQLTDGELVQLVRSGDKQAYGVLWERHSRAGLRAARSFANLAEPDDLVSEAFVQIFRTLQGPNGPTGAFRPYLYVTIRNLAMRNARNNHESSDDDLDSVPSEESNPEEVERALDRSLTASAFRALPERWQTVLWYTEVERMSPTETATLMGIAPNAVSALAYRARTALRTAWLQSHVSDTSINEECRSTLSNLGEYSRGTLTARQERTIRAHLRTCTRCAIIADEVDEVSGRLTVVLLPLLLGGGAAAAFAHSLATSPAPALASATPPDPSAGASAGAVVGTTAFTVPMIAASVAVIVALAVGATAVATGGFGTRAESGPGIAEPLAIPVPVDPQVDPTADPTPSPTPEPSTTTPPVTPPITPPPTLTPDEGATTGSGELEGGVTVLVPLAAPVVAGAATVLTNQPAYLLSGTGKPGAVIDISRQGSTLATTTVAANGEWWWTASKLVEGVNELKFAQSLTGFAPSTHAKIELELDTIDPLAPVAADTWSGSGSTKPEMRGTAEPGATVVIRSASGVELATVVADSAGNWATGDIPGLDPASTSLTAIQIDHAGNESTPTVLGPFAFVPAITSPIDNAVIAPSKVPIEFTGWPNARIMVHFAGQDFPFQLEADGTLSRTANSGGGPLSPGEYQVVVAYIGEDGTVSATSGQVNFTIAQ